MRPTEDYCYTECFYCGKTVDIEDLILTVYEDGRRDAIEELRTFLESIGRALKDTGCAEKGKVKHESSDHGQKTVGAGAVKTST